MGKARKTKSGSWRIQLYLGRDPNGKQIIKSITAPTKKEAEAKAAEYRIRGAKPTRETVRTAIADYISSREAVLSPATIRDYRAAEKALSKHFPVLMDTKLDAVDETKAQRLINGLAGLYKPSSLRLYYALFTMSLRARGIQFRTCTLPPKNRRDATIPTAETAREIFCKARGTSLEIPILLAACGLRAAEICAVSPDDITGNILHVHQARVAKEKGGYVTKCTKTAGSDRYIRIPQVLADMITAQGYAARIRPDSLSSAHNLFLKRNGFEHFRLHDWRHFMASTLHAIGCTDEFIMSQGGWTSDTTMKRVYRHLMADSAPAMADKAAAHIAELMPPPLKLAD